MWEEEGKWSEGRLWYACRWVRGRASEGRHEAQGRLQLSGTGNKAQQSEDQRHVQMVLDVKLYSDVWFRLMDG